MILNLTSRDTPLQDQVDSLINEVGSAINPICQQLLEAFKREDADAQHFAIFSLGYTMCRDQYLEQANKNLKEEISGTHRKLSSISETLQEIKPYIERNFKEETNLRRQELKNNHEENIRELESQATGLLVTHDHQVKKNPPMSPTIKGKYKKYFGALFPSLEREYNDGGDPEKIFIKYKQIRKEKKRSNL